MNTLWHPHAKRIVVPSGPMGPGGPKFVVHTTEGMDFDAMVRVLQEKGAEPHFLLGVTDGGKRRLVQFIPINEYSRGLEHPIGTPATNTANAIQVEVCQFAKNAQKWPPAVYRHLHLLMLWCHRHGNVPMRADHPFFGQHGYHRLSPQGWIEASGLVGHCHAPNQPSGHWDPGSLPADRVVK